MVAESEFFLVIIACSAISQSAETVAGFIVGDGCHVIIAIAITAMFVSTAEASPETIVVAGRSIVQKGDHNADHDDSGEDTSHRQANRGFTESSRTCRV